MKQPPPERLRGVFWSHDIGFIVDPQGLSARFPRSVAINEKHYHERLLRTKCIPASAQSNVTSWTIARLFVLTNGRLGFAPESDDKLFNDGGCVWANFVAFDRKFAPGAFFDLYGYPTELLLRGTCSQDFDAEMIVDAFTAALVAEPMSLSECKVAVVDTDPADNPGKLGATFFYGWDGQRFF